MAALLESLRFFDVPWRLLSRPDRALTRLYLPFWFALSPGAEEQPKKKRGEKGGKAGGEAVAAAGSPSPTSPDGRPAHSGGGGGIASAQLNGEVVGQSTGGAAPAAGAGAAQLVEGLA